MEDIGPEATKRPRLDAFGAAPPMHRLQQQHPESPLPLHTYPGQALRPPSAYNQPLPPSPYESAHEPRNLPEPGQHQYPHSHSGYNTPIRESRPYQAEPPYKTEQTYKIEPSYSRHGSGSAPQRSPDEGPPPHPSLRPLNTVSANEGQHYPQHPPNSYTDSYAHPVAPAGHPVHEPHSNGAPHGLPMTAHHDPAHRPPGSMGGYIESPVGVGPAPYSAGPYGSSQDWRNMQQGQRKNTRALQACDTCRSRKAKCDEGKPICGYCRDNNQHCRYKEVAPPKADRAQKEIMDKLNAITERLDKIEKNQSGSSRHSETDIRSIPLHSETGSPDRKPLVAPLDPLMGDQDVSNTHAELHTTPTTCAEASYGSIAVDHTTGAHNLVRWPSIKALLKNYRPVSEDYVMEMEEKKGLLRLYGRGQGRDTWDGGTGGPASPATSASSGRSEETARSPASLSPPDVWGTALTPTIIPDPKSYQDHPGGLNPDGTLKLDQKTMQRLLESYLNKLHILHPFLNKSRLLRMFQRVSQQANPGETNVIRSPLVLYGSSSWVGEPALNKPTKRKHTESTPDTHTSAASRSSNTEQALERRISTAIVLLVMALGKICEHKGPLPGPIKETEVLHTVQMESPRFYSDSPPNPMIKPSPTPSSVSLPSPAASEFRAPMPSRRSSADPQAYFGHRPEKNVDVIPGLAYFARATEILGTLIGGQDLMNVQACLLASLYASQMACVLEAWTWIQNACRACHFLIRDPTLRKESDATRANMIRFAYWTCVQFEGDILAELDLRSSGIERAEHEITVDYPNGVAEDGAGIGDSTNNSEGMVLVYYSFQIYLRTTLNKIQTIMYPPGSGHAEISLSARDKCEQMLNDWLHVLPEQLRWSHSDPPATDINVARLRAKYYGALYILHRPFLNFALHSQSLRDSLNQHLEPYPTSRYGSPNNRQPGGMAPPNRGGGPESDQIKEILRSVKQCINAAMRSTEALDGVRKKERLVVTNIFGTAHAQFGNMLVLAATYRSHLGKLVDKANFLRLLDRTINFLSELGAISTTLQADAEILQHVKKIIINDEREREQSQQQQNSSFSSIYSA